MEISRDQFFREVAEHVHKTDEFIKGVIAAVDCFYLKDRDDYVVPADFIVMVTKDGSIDLGRYEKGGFFTKLPISLGRKDSSEVPVKYVCCIHEIGNSKFLAYLFSDDYGNRSVVVVHYFKNERAEQNERLMRQLEAEQE